MRGEEESERERERESMGEDERPSLTPVTVQRLMLFI